MRELRRKYEDFVEDGEVLNQASRGNVTCRKNAKQGRRPFSELGEDSDKQFHQVGYISFQQNLDAR
jgi:hypothetical protein